MMAKGSFALHAYDALGRPTHVWAKDLSSEDVTLRQRMEYGESQSNRKTHNLLGKLYHQFDEAGVETVTSYDFKGNPLSKQRKVIADSEILNVFNNADADWNVPTYRVDWTGKDETSSILDSFVYQTDMEYDALDRVTKMTYPEDVNGNRKVMTPTYNKAGNLHKVDFDGTEYVKEIAYNAKGQRLLIAFGNGIMKRYIYDNKTFRLLRQKSEKYSYSVSGNEHTYSPQSGTTRQDYGYELDLVGNILKLKDRTPNSGINNTTLGTDALDRDFDYDPLYRLLKATGRESQTQDSTTLWDNSPKTSTPTPQNVRSYTRKYWYDKMGHMEKLEHDATNNNFTRNFNLISGTNQVDKVTDNQSPANTLSDFTWDDSGNLKASGTTRNYEWDHSNQLRAYYNQTGTNEPSVYAHYLYDAGGNRVKKLVRTQGGDYETTVYVDDGFEYHYKEKNSNTYEKNYCHIMDNSSRIAMLRYGTAFPDDISNTEVYNLEDHLGSSSVRLDSNGAIVDKEEYYPFGDSSLRTFDKKRYRFTGKEKDSESGLYYFGARYYAAWTCRFISVDPMAAQSAYQSSYAYGDNNPIVNNDPTGNQKENQVKGTSNSGKGNEGGNGGGTNESSEKSGELTRAASSEKETYKTPSGETFTHSEISKPNYAGESGVVKGHQGAASGLDNVSLRVKQGSLVSFTHEGKFYSAGFDPKTREFEGYYNPETDKRLNYEDHLVTSDQKASLNITIEIIRKNNQKHAKMTINDYNRNYLWNETVHEFKLPEQYQVNPTDINPSILSVGDKFYGKLNYEKFDEDLPARLQGTEVMYMTLSAPIPGGKYVGFNYSYVLIGGRKNGKTIFQADRIVVGASADIIPSAPGNAKQGTNEPKFKHIVKPSARDSAKLGISKEK